MACHKELTAQHTWFLYLKQHFHAYQIFFKIIPIASILCYSVSLNCLTWFIIGFHYLVDFSRTEHSWTFEKYGIERWGKVIGLVYLVRNIHIGRTCDRFPTWQKLFGGALIIINTARQGTKGNQFYCDLYILK